MDLEMSIADFLDEREGGSEGGRGGSARGMGNVRRGSRGGGARRGGARGGAARRRWRDQRRAQAWRARVLNLFEYIMLVN